MFACVHCNKKFKYESERKRHEQSHSPQFQCKICSKKFSFLSAVRRHEKQHDRKEKVQCRTCGGSFRDENLLKRHLKYAHKGQFSCSKCNAVFNSETALKTHSKVHKTQSERRFRCSYSLCGKKFNFSHHLKHHELTHSGAKQHFCNVCEKGFIQLHHLKTHMKVHEPDKWLFCTVEECKKKFATEYARKRHMATHKRKSDSGISSDSNCVSDSSTPKEDTTSYGTCSQLIVPKKHKDHLLECKTVINKTVGKIENDFLEINERYKLEEKDNITNVLNPALTENVIFNFDHDIVNTPNVPLEKSLETLAETVDCQAALGSCIVSGDNDMDKNCLCAQIYNPHNKYDIVRETQKEKNNNSIKNNVVRDSKQSNEENNNNCDDCECAQKEKSKINRYCKQTEINNLPELEYRLDGIVKIKETFDIDIKIEVMKNKKITDEVKFIPFNSCKAVLGNCIASVDGRMGEGCLCAKMIMDEEQMSAQEIAEITPLSFL